MAHLQQNALLASQSVLSYKYEKSKLFSTYVSVPSFSLVIPPLSAPTSVSALVYQFELFISCVAFIESLSQSKVLVFVWLTYNALKAVIIVLEGCFKKACLNNMKELQQKVMSIPLVDGL